MRVILPFLPALAVSGPLFMVMGLQPTGPRWWVAYLGAAMLSVAMLCLLAVVSSQAAELRRLSAHASSGKGHAPKSPIQADLA